MDLNELKDIQYEVKKKNRIINISLFVIWAVLMVVIINRYASYSFLFYKVIIVSSVLFGLGTIAKCFILRKQTNEFKKGYKSIFVSEALKKTFDNLEYYPEKGLDYDILANTKMMYMGDRYSSNDYFEAEYKGVKFRQADVEIEEEYESTDSDGHTTTEYVTVFMGKWMIFDFNKTFNANIQVCQKGFGNSRLYDWKEKVKYKKVEMDDSEFNKLFTIHAQDEHDAFYILTPSFMEKIKKLSNDMDGKLLLCFIGNELHIGLYNNKDAFEYNILKEINESEINDKMSNDIKIITDFIDQLNLDNSLFKKES